MLPSPKPEMSADDTNMGGAENRFQQKEGGAEAALLAARHSTGTTLSPS
jgi:hypothetical protein